MYVDKNFIIKTCLFLLCVSTSANCCKLPTLFEQALNCLLDRVTIERRVQELEAFGLLPSESLPCVDNGIFCKNAFFIRSFMFNKCVHNKFRVSKVADLSRPNLQMCIEKKGLCVNDWLVTGRSDGVIELIDTKTAKRIKRIETDKGAFSSMTCVDEVLLTAKIDANEICLWRLNSMEILRRISTFLPTVFMQIINNDILLVLNTVGCIDFYDLNLADSSLNLTTGIDGIALAASWSDCNKRLSVTTSTAKYLVELGGLIDNYIMLHKLLRDLRIDQAIFIAYFLRPGILSFPKNYKLKMIFESLPVELRKLLMSA